jgi:hypothetical protein
VMANSTHSVNAGVARSHFALAPNDVAGGRRGRIKVNINQPPQRF